MLSIEDLRKGFGSGRRRLEVLKGINLKVEKGELVSLMGPSGCGKSTLLNIIGGLLEADSGNITLENFDYGTKSPNKVVDVRRNGVGWIFQDCHLVDRLSALDNVAFSLELSGMSAKEAEDRAWTALERVGLGDRMEFIPDQLSGGQRQRVSIARALMVNPSVLILDEPTSSLDIYTQKKILHLLQSLQNEYKMSYVFISHDLRIVSKIADRIIVLYKGSIVEHGKTADVLRYPSHDYTKKLIDSNY